MNRWWPSLLLVPLVLVLGFFAQPVLGGVRDADDTVASPTPEMTPSPSVSGSFRLVRPGTALPPGVSVAGLPVGGLTPDEVRAALSNHRLVPLHEPLELRLDGQSVLVDPAELGLQADVDAVMAQAVAYIRPQPLHPRVIYLCPGRRWMDPPPKPPVGIGVVGTPFPDIALPLDVDESALRSFLGDLAEGYDRTALPLRSVVMTETAVLSASGVLTASCSPGGEVIAFSEPRSGRRLNVDASVPLVVPVLRRWSRDGGPIELVVEQVAPPPTDLTLLQRVLREQVEDMPGVVGVYVRDLSSGEQVGVNDRVSFSTASAIKIAIMLQAYRVLNEPLDGAAASQMWAMMVDSDNDAANHLLAVGGLGNEETGARLMTWMLHLIGLGDTFMCIGFDGEDCPEAAPPDGWLVDDSGQDRGDPLTSLDPFRQTTARDMGLLMTRLHECSLGQGPILEHFPGQITPEECQAMLGLMEHNADSRRMVAGLPAGVTVAHKTGWITDMKTDVGIVFSPGGAYVLSVFVWQEGELLDSEANSRIASLSWITYAFFNPLGTAQGPDGAATAGGSPTD